MHLRKTIYILFAFFASVASSFAEESELPVVEMTADRTIIYPQRMELNGEETLFDLLQLYPDLLTNGHDNWLEGYSIRINNGTYGGDMRIILKETKASSIQMVQISDNPGVAKGTTGINGVVDVFLLPQEQGPHGTIGAQISTNLTVTPSVGFTYGSENTDILVNSSYNYRHTRPIPTHEQYGNFHMINRLSEKDELYTYFTESYARVHSVVDTLRADDRDFNAQIRHYHHFTPKAGMMTALIYHHTFAPRVRFSLNDGHTISFMSSDWQGTIAACQEMGMTFFDGFHLYAGWEFDYGMGDQREEDAESQLAKRTLNYRVMNADAYFELDYTYKQWRFTFGDRLMFYRYRVDVPVGDRSHNDWRNMTHISVIYTPHHEHQIQAAFVRKFYNPSYMGLFREAKGMTDEEWLLAEKNITERQLNEVKLGYGFTRKDLSVRTNAYYYDVQDTYNFFKFDIAAYYKYRFFSMAGGVDWYVSKENHYASFRFVPVFYLPYRMQVKANFLYYTPGSPIRSYNGKPVYLVIQYNKQFGKTVDLFAEWHDIFNGTYGVGLLGVLLRL